MDAIESLMGWKSSLWIVEAGKPVLQAYGSKGMSGPEHMVETDRVKQLIQTLDDGIVGWVYRNGLALRTGDVKHNSFYVVANPDVESELCVPMKLGGKTIGCINVESKASNAFSEHDERLLMTLANQAGGAIENARLFEETRRRAGRQSVLNTIIMNATRAGTDLEGLLNTTLDQTLKAFGLDMGAIWITITQHGIKPVATRGVPPTLSMMLTSVPMMGDASLNSTIIVGESDVPEIPLTQMMEQLNVLGALIAH